MAVLYDSGTQVHVQCKLSLTPSGRGGEKLKQAICGVATGSKRSVVRRPGASDLWCGDREQAICGAATGDRQQAQLLVRTSD